MDDKEWTDAELQQVHSLYAQAWSVSQVARRLGRDEQSVRDRVSIAKNRKGVVPLPDTME